MKRAVYEFTGHRESNADENIFAVCKSYVISSQGMIEMGAQTPKMIEVA